MRKILILIAVVMMFLIPLNVASQQDGILRVFGVVESNGEELENVEIIVLNKDSGEIWITKTNTNGSYDILVPAKNGDLISVKANYNSKSIEKEFTIHKDQKAYEINFEFEESTPIKVVGKVITFIKGLDVFTIIFYMLLFLFFLLIIVGILHHTKGYMRENNKYKKHR